jgi:C4-dicarboxylate-specific signal transduction histidine kinase
MEYKDSLKSARFFKLWMEKPGEAVKQLVKEVQTTKLFKPEIIVYESGSVLIKEFESNAYIYVLLEGEVDLLKWIDGEGQVKVTSVQHGSLFGLMSFFSGQHALTTAVAVTHCSVFRLRKKEVDQLLASSHAIAVMSRQLLISNLMQRYRQVVDLNVELHKLNTEIELERRRLNEALEKLKNAHERLVHQEKMATLGQLVAGIAHEINNPVAALDNSTGYLKDLLPMVFDAIRSLNLDRTAMFLDSGLSYSGTTIPTREQLNEVSIQYPELKPTDHRRLFLLEEKSYAYILELYQHRRYHEVTSYLKVAEAGSHLRRIATTSSRISGLVRSLKQYSRQDRTGERSTNLAEGIQDTLLILGNRMKHLEVAVNVPNDLPPVYGDPGEWNQVWTNILVNSCDVLGDTGRIRITAIKKENTIRVLIEDSGPGIPLENREKIFQPHFTTRNSTGNFGLGLGLFITRELVGKNKGTIRVADSGMGGAAFELWLTCI